MSALLRAVLALAFTCLVTAGFAADQSLPFGNGLAKKFKDNGDGTWSEQMYCANCSGGGGGGGTGAITAPLGTSTAPGAAVSVVFPTGSSLPAFAAIPTFKIDQTTPGTTNKVSIGSDGSVSITGSLPGFASTPAVSISGTPAVTLSGSLPGFASTPAVSISGTPAVSISGTPSVSLSGSLPAFASTPAFSISGTLPAFASTPAFTVSGTLPAFASPPAVSVNGKTTEVCATPTVTSASAYAAGNLVGGLLTFANAVGSTQTGILQSIRLTMQGVQTAQFNVFFFSANPSNSTWTDKTAPAINAADVVAVQPVIALASGSNGLGTHSVYGSDGIGRGIKLGSTSLYAVITTSGTPTFSSTSGVQLCATILQD